LTMGSWGSRRTGRATMAVIVIALTACGGDGGSAEALCRAVAEGDAVTTTFQGFDPTDAEAALERLRSARVTLGELLDEAPSAVREDLQVEIDYLQALIDALEAVEPGDARQAALQVQAVTDAHPEVADAAAALSAFAEREC
jgi:hypothetical protein